MHTGNNYTIQLCYILTCGILILGKICKNEIH